MKTIIKITCILLMTSLVSSCDEEGGLFDLGDSSKLSSYSESGGSSGGGDNQGDGGEAGLITAGEWNDLDNWDFWNDLVDGQDYNTMPAYWDFYSNNRFSVLVMSNGEALVDSKIELFKDDDSEWIARTDNTGKAELWYGLYEETSSIQEKDFSIKINDQDVATDLTLVEDGVNELAVDMEKNSSTRVEISFIVDATGSMADELEFLKEDLKDVIQQVEDQNNALDILTSTVFYRDEQDDYLTKKSDFTSDLDETISFINKQSAAGGGDFPEAVHTALEVGINELQWSTTARTRISFLLLDAPPHYTTDIVNDIHAIVEDAARKGIKIIPITASGIDKETEFLMRFMAISTNGTYVFITDDSGIGGEHLEASVGEFKVELLNELMVRLIKQYSE